MRYFITGGAGWVGSNLVDRLVKIGDVTVYDNLSTGKIEFIEQHLKLKNFSFQQADLLDLSTLFEAIKGYDVVFHLSACNDIAGGLSQTDLDLKQGTITTYNVLESMRKLNISKIVYSSSATVYGNATLVPTPEDYGPLFPQSLYGAAKLACEGLISAYSNLYDMQAWIFRFGNVSGRHATHGVIYDFVNKLKKNPYELEILGDGSQKRPYFLVQDCVDGILFGLQNAKDKLNYFNVGVSSVTDVTTVADIVAEEMGLKNVKYKYSGTKLGFPGDVPYVSLSVEKMAKLGWRARYDSDDAVRQAIRDMLS